MRKRVKQYPFLITRDYEEDAGSVDDLLMELRDSTIVPLLLNPFQVFLTTMHLGRKSAEVFFLKQPDVDLQSNINHRKLQQSSLLFRPTLYTSKKILKEIVPALLFHDNYEFPANTSPLQITKLTCGSLITFYDSHRPDATVAVDVCLSALVLAKVLCTLGRTDLILKNLVKSLVMVMVIPLLLYCGKGTKLPTWFQRKMCKLGNGQSWEKKLELKFSQNITNENW